MKKTMKLTYLLTLLLLLFTFTACGDKEEKTTEKEDAKVEDTKDKDTENDTENTEDASSSEEESTQSGDAENDDTTTSDGSATLSDISFTVNKEWTLDSSSIEGSSLMYLIPSSNEDFNNKFNVQVTDVGTEQTDEDLQVSADEIIKAYEYIGATLVEESTFDTACGTARIFTFDATKMYETSEVTGCTTYMKRAIFVNGTKTYTVELTCLSDDFDALSKEMDNVLSSITLK